MLSPDYLGHCADGIDVLFKRLSDSVVSDMCRRITRMDFSITDSTVWQAERLQEAGLLMDDVAALVAGTLGQSKKEVKKALLDAGVQTLNFDDAIYRKAGLQPTPLRYSPAMMQMLNATVNKTSGSIQNMAMSTAGTAYSSFLDSVDLVYMQVSSGAMSVDQAVANAVRDLSAKGTTVVEYYNRAGKQLSRRDQVDVATRRAVLTGVQQTTDQLQWMRADEMGCDLMELTAHGGARPDHAAWQGRIVSRSGRKGYLSLADIGYGTPGGFQGINCRHGWFPFFEGISERNYTNAELDAMKNQSVTYNGETLSDYKASQKQREMEVEVRSLKRQLVGERAAIDSATYPSMKERLTNNFNETSVKLKNKEAELKDFTRQTGLRRQREREQVVGFGQSTAQKAVHASKNVAKQRAVEYNNAVASAKQQIAESSKKILPGQQKKHIVGTHEYEQYVAKLAGKGQFGPSRLLGGLEEARTLADKYAGTGEPRIVNGKWLNVEIVNTLDVPIGVVVNNINGIEEITTIMKIHYGKKGIHIVPDYMSKGGRR